MTRGRLLFAIVVAVAALAPLAASGGAASHGQSQPQSLFLDPVGGFHTPSPTFVTAPPGDSHRLFVVQQGGTIRLVLDGVLQATPFLDITSLVLCCGERGLLSMAFAPDYATSRRFYVYYTAVSPTGQVTIAEFLRDSANPNIADPASRRTVITQAHSEFSNHNGGQLQFGPDGYLYAGLGDGGSGGDPHRYGQNLQILLGKILRIDPRLNGTQQYTVPTDNPFVGQPPSRPEIWSYGERNPWRYSFDRENGDFTLGDVGQNLWEEIDYVPVTAGGARGVNFGWSCMEARHLYSTNCPTPPNHTPPVFEYPHTGSHNGCSITGGYVVRDPELPTLIGRYIYGDYCSTTVYSNVLQIPDVQGDAATGLSVPGGLVSFGEDACGHLYAMSQQASPNNNVWRIRDTAPPPPACLPPPPLNDSWVYATDISNGFGSAAGTTVGARGESGEPDHGVVSQPLNSVWYKLTFATPKVVLLDTCGSSLDTVLAAYKGSSTGLLSEVTSNDDACGAQSRIMFRASAGVTYTVAVDGKGSANGAFTLNYSERVLPSHPPPPPVSRAPLR